MRQYEFIKRPVFKNLNIGHPLTIPSGIITTRPTVISNLARIDALGFITTKTISLERREGYREPIIHEYWPGCFINAVGLANPGARAFLAEMSRLMPLHGSKPLFVSIMGTKPEEFLKCAEILDPIADAFELNLSCPHVKGAGQSIGSDKKAIAEILTLLKKFTNKPVIPKLSPNLGNLIEIAQLCEDGAADGLTLINTVGPGMALDDDSNPILSNIYGGLSGAGVLPIGLKAVTEVSRVVNIPIIAAGGIATANDIRSYAKAGASYFSVGSALAGLDTALLEKYLTAIVNDLQGKHLKESSGAITQLRAQIIKPGKSLLMI